MYSPSGVDGGFYGAGVKVCALVGKWSGVMVLWFGGSMVNDAMGDVGSCASDGMTAVLARLTSVILG